MTALKDRKGFKKKTFYAKGDELERFKERCKVLGIFSWQGISQALNLWLDQTEEQARAAK